MVKATVPSDSIAGPSKEYEQSKNIKEMEKTIYIPGDLVMTNGIPIERKKELFTKSQKVTQINMQK